MSDDLYARVVSETRDDETLAETLDRLVGGYDLADFADYLPAYERLEADRSPISFDADVARRAGELNGLPMKSDVVEELDGADSIIATHGLLLNEAVLTNDSDYRRVDGPAVETY